MARYFQISDRDVLGSPDVDTSEFSPLILSNDFQEHSAQWEVACNYLQPFLYVEERQSKVRITASLTPTLTQFRTSSLRELRKEVRALDSRLGYQTPFETIGIEHESIMVEGPSENTPELLDLLDGFTSEPDNLAWHEPPTAGVNPYPEELPSVLPHPKASEISQTEIDTLPSPNRLYVSHDLPLDAPLTTNSDQLIQPSQHNYPERHIVESAIACPGCGTFGHPLESSDDPTWKCTTPRTECRIKSYHRDEFAQYQSERDVLSQFR